MKSNISKINYKMKVLSIQSFKTTESNLDSTEWFWLYYYYNFPPPLHIGNTIFSLFLHTKVSFKTTIAFFLYIFLLLSRHMNQQFSWRSTHVSKWKKEECKNSIKALKTHYYWRGENNKVRIIKEMVESTLCPASVWSRNDEWLLGHGVQWYVK